MHVSGFQLYCCQTFGVISGSAIETGPDPRALSILARTHLLES